MMPRENKNNRILRFMGSPRGAKRDGGTSLAREPACEIEALFLIERFVNTLERFLEALAQSHHALVRVRQRVLERSIIECSLLKAKFIEDRRRGQARRAVRASSARSSKACRITRSWQGVVSSRSKRPRNQRDLRPML